MDSLTHIYFADKLLIATGKDRSARVSSLFPQIDRQPAYFHRMYGHPFFNIARLRDTGVEIYGGGTADEGSAYAGQRFLEERSRMQSFARTYEEETGTEPAAFEPDADSVTLAWVSHTYQDIFNNPMQGFLPHAVYPCGKWDLWARLNDAISFRATLYEDSAIQEFREEFFSLDLWDVKLNPGALVRAMVEFTATASAVPVATETVDAAYRALEIEAKFESEELKEAREFLARHEVALEQLIEKYSRPRVGVRAATAFPVGS